MALETSEAWTVEVLLAEGIGEAPLLPGALGRGLGEALEPREARELTGAGSSTVPLV